MLSHLERWFAKAFADRSARIERLRCQFRGQVEVLEARAMLSASIGTMPSQFESNDIAVPYADGPHVGDSAIFASQPHHSSEYGDGTSRNARESQLEYGRPSGQPNSVHSPVPGMHSGLRELYGISRDLAWGQFPTSPPAPLSLTFGFGMMPRTSFGDDRVSLPRIAEKETAPRWSGPQKAIHVVKPPVLLIAGQSIPSSLAPPGTETLSALNQLKGASTIASVLSASFVPSAENEPPATLSGTAYEAAFENYASERLLLAVPITSYQDVNFASASEGIVATEAEGLEDYLRTDNASPFDEYAFSTESLDNEREAVDEVLRGLHDPSTLQDESDHETVAPQDGETQLQPNVTVEQTDSVGRTPSDAGDAGMVLLQATGDANNSEYDLATVDEGGLELLDARLGVEASIGIHQAFDVAAEDASPTNSSNSPAAHVPPFPQKDAGKGASNDAEKPSFRQAAAAVGITALLGLLLGRRDERPRGR